MSLQAYQQTAQRTEGPRQTEYRLFGEVTRALMDAQNADPADFKTRVGALDWNRRLWSTLALDCSHPENQLPQAVRARIISLSVWVSRHTSEVVRNKGDYEMLIQVNRTVMQGLVPQAAQAA